MFWPSAFPIVVVPELADQLSVVLEEFAQASGSTTDGPLKIVLRPGTMGLHRSGRAVDIYEVGGKGIGQWAQEWNAAMRKSAAAKVTVGEDVPLQRFECSAEAMLRIQAVTGIVKTREALLESVRFQAGNAAGVATKVASRLQAPDATLASVFQNAFGVTHDSVPSWARPGGWSHGRIVRQRFLGARRLLKSGSLLYSCWGRPRGAGGPETNPDYLVLAVPGKYWIALGRRYWEADKNVDVDTTTHAFLFAALRAYYGPLLSSAPLAQAPVVRMIGNIHCYIQFVADLLNAKLLDWVQANCPQQA